MAEESIDTEALVYDGKSKLLQERAKTGLHALQLQAICGYVGSCKLLLVEESFVWSPP